MKGKGGLRRSMPIYLTLRTADAMRLQDLPGGDGARVAFLTSLGVQMVRCSDLGLMAVTAARQAGVDRSHQYQSWAIWCPLLL